MPTNVELVTRLMEYPKKRTADASNGPSKPWISSLCMVLASEPGSLESPMVSEASWRACAEEIRESPSSQCVGSMT